MRENWFLTLVVVVLLGLLTYTVATAQEAPPVPDTCVTIDEAINIVATAHPDVTIEEVDVDNLSITFSSATKNTNLEITFNYEGCAVSQKEVAKIVATE